MLLPILLSWAFQAAIFSLRVHAANIDKCPLSPPAEPGTPYSDDADIGPCLYTNPILNKNGVGDPWVFQFNDYYYMTYTDKPWTQVVLYRSKLLTNWDNAENKTIFTAPPDSWCSGAIWAPEIHHFDNSWYLIFTASPSGVSQGGDHIKHDVEAECVYDCEALCHRMFVVKGTGSDPNTLPDPFDATWGPQTQLETYDSFAIDGTYLVINGKRYHIYSCWETPHSVWPAMLCITLMSNPWTVTSKESERKIISRPNQPWEMTPYNRANQDKFKNGGGKERLSTNEAPQILFNQHTNQTFLIYSAGRSDNRNYCLGLLELKKDTDPMEESSWEKNIGGCVFKESDENKVYGVGHASFVKSPNGDEDWIVYHGMSDARTGWSGRMIRAQKFTWDKASGHPVFPTPYGMKQMDVPSGQSDCPKKKKVQECRHC